MLDRATVNHDQVNANTQDGHRSHDPKLTQRQSPPARRDSAAHLATRSTSIRRLRVALLVRTRRTARPRAAAACLLYVSDVRPDDLDVLFREVCVRHTVHGATVLSGRRHDFFLVLALHDALAVGEEADLSAPDLLHRVPPPGSRGQAEYRKADTAATAPGPVIAR